MISKPASRILALLGFAVLLVPRVTVANAPTGRYTKMTTGYYDTKTNLIWRADIVDETTWANANVQCRALGKSWRLPTIKELSTLLDYSQTTRPMVDQTAFKNTPPANFWTATPLAGSAVDGGQEFWFVNFAPPALASYIPATARAYARCVQ